MQITRKKQGLHQSIASPSMHQGGSGIKVTPKMRPTYCHLRIVGAASATWNYNIFCIFSFILSIDEGILLLA